ncbi:MAG: anaerobic ribonucleoside-triphosphate reductase activating protein [Clostridia bacterium]|nr:anaerobic ribonucleoside-triphosphate reductase activating protein [Clostridia bacterium]
MVFSGFQKLTLLDYPGRVACTLFTAGCNLRCPFCHNASLVTHINNEIVYPRDEVLSYLQKRKGLLEGVCITGGEPLLHNDLEDFILEVKKLGYFVKLDTNGTFPEKLKRLVNSSLIDYVAMDIKNCMDKYALTVGIESFNVSDIEESVDFLLQNKIDYEFRTTVVNEFHTVQDIENIAKWISGAPRYFLQNFIDSGDLIGDNLSSVDLEVLSEMKNISTKYVQNTEIRGI